MVNIEKLVEARRLFNELSDKIYAIAYGGLEETDYAVIYQNYESQVRDDLMTLFPKHRNFLANYFDWIILTWASSKEVAFFVDNKEMRIRKGIDFYNMLADNNHIECGTEEWAVE